MLERLPQSLLAVAIATAIVAATSRTAQAAEDLGAVEDKTNALFSSGDRPILRYRHADVPNKPYVDQIFSPGGVQVLRDSPHDHKHHHALMFATAVDGVDFWSETPQCGTQKTSSLNVLSRSTGRLGGWLLSVAEELEWLGPRSDKPLLVESRLIYMPEYFVRNYEDSDLDATLDATLVEWQSRLRTPPGKGTAVLTGDHYFGLGMRFLQSMDGGRFFNADDKVGEVVRGDERLTPVKWCAYTAKADGKPVTVAVFDHPTNFRYPAKMFTMSKPFAYLSATRNEWKEPITIKAGKPLDLRYAVAVWDGAVDTKTVEKLYQRWLKLTR